MAGDWNGNSNYLNGMEIRVRDKVALRSRARGADRPELLDVYDISATVGRRDLTLKARLLALAEILSSQQMRGFPSTAIS
jgi:hypothetical protein